MVGRFGWSTIFVAMGTREGLAVISFAILGRSVVVLYYSHSLPGLRRHCATRCLLSPAGQQIPPIPNPHGMSWQETSRPPDPPGFESPHYHYVRINSSAHRHWSAAPHRIIIGPRKTCPFSGLDHLRAPLQIQPIIDWFQWGESPNEFNPRRLAILREEDVIYGLFTRVAQP